MNLYSKKIFPVLFILIIFASENSYAQLFPNPAHSTLIVKWSKEVSDELSYKVVSVDGRTVLNGSLTRDVNSIEVAILSPGFYLLQVQNANGSMETKPFVKQ